MRVVIAEDHALMREAVRLALEESQNIEVVGEARSGSEVLPLVASTAPDVVLLDLRMPEMDGLTCLKRIKKHYPEVKAVMLSAVEDQREIQAALDLGASGYIVKTIRPNELAPALRRAVEEGAGGAHAVGAREARTTAPAAGISEKELEVLRQLAKGRSNKEIAKELFVSEQTVKFHLRNIYRKLEAANRTEALRHAYERRLLESPLYEQMSR